MGVYKFTNPRIFPRYNVDYTYSNYLNAGASKTIGTGETGDKYIIFTSRGAVLLLLFYTSGNFGVISFAGDYTNHMSVTSAGTAKATIKNTYGANYAVIVLHVGGR